LVSGSGLVALSLSLPQGWAGDAAYWTVLCVGMAIGFVPSSLAAISVGVRDGFAGFAIYLPLMVLAAWAPWALLRRGPAGPLRVFLERERRVGQFLSFVEKSPFALLVGIRLAPFAVFSWTNALFALSPIGLLPYLAGTAIGAAPRTLAMIAAGNGARSLAEALERGEDPLLRGLVLGAGILGLLVLAGLAGKALLARSRDASA